jgi:hypothetical protein
MKKLNAFFMCGLLTVIFCQGLDAQKVSLSAWKDRINQFTANFPQEKVYLHLDNTDYFLGDTLWFKAYVVTTPELTKTNLSQTLYVDLLSPEGYVIASKNLHIENGGCHGEFILEKPLESGFCEIRAYTRYMLNFGQENLFSRVVPVFNARIPSADQLVRSMTPRKFPIPLKRIKEQPIVTKKKDAPMDVTLQFYPEGGNIVRDIENKVAFKVTDADGRNLEISANLLNGDKQVVKDIKTLRQGMGVFSFTPKNGAYSLSFQYKSKTYSFCLPKIETTGYVLSAENIRGENLVIRVRKSPNEPADSIGLCLTCRGVAVGYIPLFTDKYNYEFSVPWKNLPTGVIQLNLYHKQGQILCQRQVFAGRSLPLSIDCTIERKECAPGQEIQLDFSTVNAEKSPTPATFSLAVRDASTQEPFVSYASTYADFLLTSELKGYIEDPEWYFTKTDEKKLQALDLLMMVQGWTRYPWYQLTGLEPFALKQPVDKGILVSGRIFPRIQNFLPDGTEVHLEMDSSGHTITKVFNTGPDGLFGFWSDVQGKWKLRLVDEKRMRDMSIRLVPSPGASINPRPYDPVETQVLVRNAPSVEPIVNISSANYFESQGFKDYILQNASLIYNFDSINDFSINKPQLPENVLKFLFQENNNFRLSNMTGSIGTFKEVTYTNIPVVFFDNKIQMTTDILMQVLETRIQDIAQIALVENRSICKRIVDNTDLLYKVDMKGDPICIFLFYKNGQIVRKRLNDPPSYQTFFLDGYAAPLTFKPQPFGSLPDSKIHRRTQYWNPDLKTDASGKAKVLMYMDRKDQEISISAEGLLQ